jgi:adenylosuccinate lyase
MSDTLPTATRVADPGIRALYTLETRWQAWLDVEAALAKAQAELDIIPSAAAEPIARAARLELLDRARIDAGLARTGHTLVPLIWELARVVGEPHGGWVHWGATTQNITQTGDLLVLRQAHRILLRLIGEALAAMAALAQRGADMVVAGRTHGQHAVPATFGYKVAVWIDELLRHVERMQQAAPRLFVAMLGGGAGTFASLGKRGPLVQAGIAKHLGMGSMQVPSRALADHRAENICLLGMLAATCGKIGREIYTLMKTEFGEVEEPVPPGTVGSSTMPQKRNPKLCQDVIALCADVRSCVPLALEAMQTEHEADRTTSLMMDAAEARAVIAMGDALSRLGVVTRELGLDPARMRRNLELGGGLIMAEAVMLQLGTTLGRQHAHDVVYDAAQAAFVEGRAFAAVLAADPRVTAHLEGAAIDSLLDPVAYTGLCADMARAAAARAQSAAAQIAPASPSVGGGARL